MTRLIEQRLDELESRLAFQDDIIENLSDVVARQDREILSLQLRLGNLAERVKEFGDQGSIEASPPEVEIPPHY